MILMRVKNWLQRITARINNWVPIKIHGTSFIVRNTNISIVIKQSQFLLRLSWAFAIHKVQSLSLQEPVLSFDLQRQKIFKPGQMYLVHLQLFSIKHKIVLLQVFDVKFLFSQNHVFRKQKRTAVSGLMDARP